MTDEEGEICSKTGRKESSLDKSEISNSVKTRHVKFGILPCVKTASLRPDANMEEHVSSDMLRLRRSPARSQRKVV